MIKSVTVTNYTGHKLKLELASPEKSGFAVVGITGLEPGKATINITEIPTNDGGVYNSARLPSRNIVIGVRFMWSPNRTIEETRHILYSYFPIMKDLTLLIETDTRYVEIKGYVESNQPAIFSKDPGSVISILCPDPYFYSAGPDGKMTTVFNSIDPGLEFPFSNESYSEKLIELGTITNLPSRVVKYEGDASIGVSIFMSAIGTVGDVTIYNTITGERMSIDVAKLAAFTGSGIINGDDITICTIKGKKSITLVRNGESVNILNCLTKDSDWFQLVQGDNIFTYVAETGQLNLQFKIENQIVYGGL